MRFGEKLRQLRQDGHFTQPELAASLGIEQSYLSKLENDKSLPSGDVLNRILDVFSLTVGDLVDDLDQGARNKMRQLPVVADYFSRQKHLIIGNRRRWLFGSMLLLAFGAALIYGGTKHLFVGDRIYTYESYGVVLDGESKEIFSAVESGDFRRNLGLDLADLEALRERLDQRYIRTSNYRGEIFSIPVDGGTRTYAVTGVRPVDGWQNKAAAMIGVFLLVLGAAGIFLEKKLSRYQ